VIKQDFLKELEKALCGLPDDDTQKSLEFYSEMIDDKIEDGLSEEDAVSQIGNIEDIAKQILSDIPITKLVKQKIKPKRSMGAVEIILLILGSPIWLSLLIALFAVVFSIYVALWSVIISLYAVSASLLACGVAGVLSFVGFSILGNAVPGTFVAGAGLVCLGLAIFMFIVSNLVTKCLVWLSKKIWLGIKSSFIRKGENNEKI